MSEKEARFFVITGNRGPEEMTAQLDRWSEHGCEPMQANLDGAAWWALMRRREAPKDERAELWKAAQKIKKECKRRDYCEDKGGCPFFRCGECFFGAGENPCGWEFGEGEYV